MSGLITRMVDLHVGGPYREDRAVESLADSIRVNLEKRVREVIERYEHAALDAKADREAVIKALVEALS